MKLISNLVKNHGSSITELLNESYDELFFVSPFLATDFQELFGEDGFSNVKKVTLVTTLKKNDNDQITKPLSLKTFYSLMGEKCPKAKVNVHIDNGLHGKIYIFKKDAKFKAIITSANLTKSGFYYNHEWGLLIDDSDVIKRLENEVLENIDYPEITESLVDRLLRHSDTHQKMNPKWSEVVRPDSDIMEEVYYQGQNTNREPRYYLKPIGVSEEPIWKDSKNDYSALHQNLAFSKKGTGAIRAGDIVITTAVGCGCLLSYFQITGSPMEATYEERKVSTWKERWPWHIEGRNLSINYGGNWWEYDLERQSLLEDFIEKFPGKAVTTAGGKTLGTLKFGSDKVEITKEFADFLTSKIDEIN